jgi:hypothetical protein
MEKQRIVSVQIRVTEHEWLELEGIALKRSKPGDRKHVATIVRELIDRHLLNEKKEQ